MIRLEDYDGALCPVFICEQCDQPIQGPEQPGLIQWNDWEKPTSFTTLHKGPHMPCSRQWEREHGKDWKGWRPLDKFLAQLSYNTQHPFEQAS
jgi:hypothetical protein